MEEDWSHMTERIINLTLEIIYLLTGENSPKVTFGNHVTITVPPCHSLIPKRHTKQKIVKTTHRIVELLVGEDEEGECLEEQKDQEQNIVAEGQIPPNHQGMVNHEDVTRKKPYTEGYKDVTVEKQPSLTLVDGFSNRNPPEQCTSPLYSPDCPQKDHIIHYQKQHIAMKVVVKEETETAYVRGDQQSMEVGEVMETIKQEECFPDIRTTGGHDVGITLEEHLMTHPDDTAENNGVTQCIPEEIPVTRDTHHRACSTDRGNVLSGGEESSIFTDRGGQRHDKIFLGFESFADKDHLSCEPPFPCSECGKLFNYKEGLTKHQKFHIGAHPFLCLECGKCFSKKGNLLKHQQTHTDERSFSCSECGKQFIQKGHLLKHQKTHTGVRPFSCSVCGKCFSEKGSLHRHQRSHTGERPYSCPECGKGFIQKGDLVKHHRIHTGERPFSCSECGKCFTERGTLLRHQRTHTSNLPISHQGYSDGFFVEANLFTLR